MEDCFQMRVVQVEGVAKEEVVLLLSEMRLAGDACVGTRRYDVLKVLVHQRAVSAHVSDEEVE